MKAYTDYPLIELGDVSGELAPVREVTILNYDGDKYATVEFDGKEYEFKSGYLYTAPGRFGEVSQVPTGQMPQN